MKHPAYPKILTNTDWQRHKGKIAKLAGKTGIGAQMDKVKKTFDAVDWRQFALESSDAPATLAQIDKLRDNAARQMGKVKEVERESAELARIARTTAAQWRKRRTIPSSSRKHAEAVHDATVLFTQQISVEAVIGDLNKQYEELKASVPTRPEQHGAIPRSAEEFLERCGARIDRDDYLRFLRHQVNADTGRAVSRFSDTEICKQAYAVFGSSLLMAQKYRAL